MTSRTSHTLFGLTMRWWITAGLIIMLSGCIRLGPDFQRPEVRLDETWMEQTPGSSRKPPPVHWWQGFHDPLLNRLIEEVRRQNPGMQKAAIRIQQARAQLGIARGNLFPQKQQLSMEFFYDQLSEQSPYYQSTGAYLFTSFQTGFDAVWEIDLWGRFKRSIEAAGAQLAVSIYDYEDVLISLTAETASAYIQMRAFEERLKIARDNAGLQEQGFRITESLFRNGLNTELDLRQAQALWKTTLAEMAQLETGLRQSRNALSLLLGWPSGHWLTELEQSGRIPEADDAISTGIPAELLRRRPDIRREEFRAAAQSALIGVAKADLLPRFSLYGSIGTASGGFNGVDAFDVFSTQAMAAKFGPTVSWPVLQYGRMKNRVKVEDARLQELLVSYRETVLNAMREVEDALVAFHKTREQIRHVQEAVTAASKASELALSQYRHGIENYPRVLNSQLFLMQQQNHLTHLRSESARQLIAVYKALGGGWELHERRPSSLGGPDLEGATP